MFFVSHKFNFTVVPLLILTLVLAACGGENFTATSAPTTAAVSYTTVITTAAAATQATTAAATSPALVLSPTTTATTNVPAKNSVAATATSTPASPAPSPTGGTTSPSQAAKPAVSFSYLPVDPLSKADPNLVDILTIYTSTQGTIDQKLKAATDFAAEIGVIDKTKEVEFEVILVNGAQTQAVADKIKALGATVDDIDDISGTNYLLVTVPFNTFVTFKNATTGDNFLRDLAILKEVSEINLPDDESTQELRGLEPTLNALLQKAEATKNQGVKVMGIDKWQAAGITGKGVTVGIIDSGFKFRDQLKSAGVLPADFEVMDLSQKLLNEPSVDDGVHGSAVSEIIYSIAPGAKIIATSIQGTAGEFSEAIDYLVSQKVDLISISMGNNAEPENGTSPLSKKIEQVRKDNGILFFLAAGNEGTEHYAGYFTPGDKGFHQWVPGVTRMAVGNPSGETLKSSVLLRWDQWLDGSVNPDATDLDLYLEDEAGNIIGVSDGDQRVRTPREFIPVEIPANTNYYIKVKQKEGTSAPSGPVRLHIFVTGGTQPQFYTPVMSVGSQADSKGAIAVGAVDPPEGNEIGDYSSQGPLSDGRFKPDISGPAGVDSAAYEAKGGKAFNGTSAATPEVAGMAAILKSANLALSADELTQVILESVKVPAGGPNTVYGLGRADLSNITPGPVKPKGAQVQFPAPNPNPQFPLKVSTLYPAPAQPQVGTAAPAATPSPAPVIKNLDVDPALAAAVAKTIKGANVEGIKFLTVDLPEAQVAAELEASATGNGYKFAIPGAVKPVKSGNYITALYTKEGAGDIFFSIGTIPDDPSDGFFTVEGADPALLQKLYTQLKGQKTFLITATGTNFVKAFGG